LGYGQRRGNQVFPPDKTKEGASVREAVLEDWENVFEKD
jgi:hypothetical protein